VIPDQAPILNYVHTMRSRYSETDKMGYVYYGRYLEYFEVARTEMIRAIGVPYSKLEDQGVMLPVIESHIEYKAPLLYDDEILVNVLMFDTPAVKLETYYKMSTSRTDTVHAVGKVILCFMNDKTRKPRRVPERFLQHFAAATDH
jgi:acyl-CoA thioester hydrolase